MKKKLCIYNQLSQTLIIFEFGLIDTICHLVSIPEILIASELSVDTAEAYQHLPACSILEIFKKHLSSQ